MVARQPALRDWSRAAKTTRLQQPGDLLNLRTTSPEAQKVPLGTTKTWPCMLCCCAARPRPTALGIELVHLSYCQVVRELPQERCGDALALLGCWAVLQASSNGLRRSTAARRAHHRRGMARHLIGNNNRRRSATRRTRSSRSATRRTHRDGHRPATLPATVRRPATPRRNHSNSNSNSSTARRRRPPRRRLDKRPAPRPSRRTSRHHNPKTRKQSRTTCPRRRTPRCSSTSIKNIFSGS